MTASGASAALAPLADLRRRAQARWATLAPRERRLLQAAGGVIALALVWMLLVQPAWRTLRDTPARLEAVELQLQQMQRLAAEARELRAMPAVGAAQAEAALQAATVRLGPNAKLVLQGERATLSVNGVAGEALVVWLGEVRSAARARPDEAQLSRGATGYTGSVVLSLARSPRQTSP